MQAIDKIAGSVGLRCASLIFACLVMLPCSVARSAIVTIDFDDLSPANGNFFVPGTDDRPNPYGGIFWSDINMITHSHYSAAYSDPTLFPSMSLAAFTNSAGNGAVGEVDPSFGAPLFDLVSIAISKVWPNIGSFAATQVTITGWNSGNMLASQVVPLTNDWQVVTLGAGFTSLDEFRIINSAGGGFFLFDSVVLNSVPEPGSLGLFVPALMGGLLGYRRRF